MRDNLEKIAVPAVIVFGEEDRLIPNPYLHGGRARSVMGYGASKIPGAQLEGFERCGHTVQMDCPDLYNPRVLKFLSELKWEASPVDAEQAPLPVTP